MNQKRYTITNHLCRHCNNRLLYDVDSANLDPEYFNPNYLCSGCERESSIFGGPYGLCWCGNEEDGVQYRCGREPGRGGDIAVINGKVCVRRYPRDDN